MSCNSVCAIQGCFNKKQQKSRKHIYFYRFPKLKAVTKQWVEASGREDLAEILVSEGADYFYKKLYVVCSDHFELKCFKSKNLKEGLIKSAVPTKNLYNRRSVKSCSEDMVELEVSDVKIKVEMVECQGCLSADRRTAPLGHLAKIYSFLVGSTTKDEPIFFCWECAATLRRLERFQKQLKHAQDILKIYQDSRQSLSTLSTKQKDYYDQEINYLDSIPDKSELKTDMTIKKETPIGNIEEVKSWDGLCDAVSEKEDYSDTVLEEFDDQTNDDTKDTTVNVPNAVVKKKKKKWLKNVKKEYKSYATHIYREDLKKPYTQYFQKVQLDEADIELYFLKSDRKRQGYKMHLKCKECSLIYGRKIDLDRHNNLNHHKANTPYNCLHCNTRQPSLELLREHWRTHSVFYRCVMCSCHVFPCSLALHLSRSHVNVYACTSCKLTFSSLVSFTEHYNKNHPFVCDYCNKKCALKSVLEKHIKNHHTSAWCGTCSKQYLSHALYRAHCRELHPRVLNLAVLPELTYCVECDAQYPSLALYKKHIKTKHTEKPMKLKRTSCPECGKVFNKNSDMRLHYNFSHVKVTKFHCQLCDKYFLRPYGLRTHMESVHLKLPKPKNKICDICGRAFHSNSVLKNHRRTHTGERPFKCGFCPAAFAQKGAMRIHQRKQHSANRSPTTDQLIPDKIPPAF